MSWMAFIYQTIQLIINFFVGVDSILVKASQNSERVSDILIQTPVIFIRNVCKWQILYVHGSYKQFRSAVLIERSIYKCFDLAHQMKHNHPSSEKFTLKIQILLRWNHFSFSTTKNVCLINEKRCFYMYTSPN